MLEKPIKGTKDSDSNLVSNKNLAKGQVTWAKNLPQLWCHPSVPLHHICYHCS